MINSPHPFISCRDLIMTKIVLLMQINTSFFLISFETKFSVQKIHFSYLSSIIIILYIIYIIILYI